MALRELVTVLRYELREGELKRYVEGYKRAEKSAQKIAGHVSSAANTAATKLRTAMQASSAASNRMEKNLKGLSPAMQRLATQAREMQRNFDRSNAPASRLARGLGRLTSGARDFGRALRDGVRLGYRDAIRDLDRIEARQRRLSRRGQSRGSGGGELGGAVRGVLAGLSGMTAARASDEWAGTKARIGLQTGSNAERDRSVGFLFATAQQAGQDYSSLADTFVSMARGRDSLKLSNDSTLVLAETVGKLMTIGGGSAQSQQAALVQFGQAMNTGVLRGEELNSIMEQAPRLAKAIADALGVSVGELRAMGAEGKITGRQIATGLLRQTEQVDEEFRRLPMTFSRSLTMIRNQFVRRVGELNENTKAAERFNQVAGLIIANMEKIGAVIGLIAASWAAVKVFGVLSKVFVALSRSGRVLLLFFTRLGQGRWAQAFAKFGPVGLQFLRTMRWIVATISALGAVGTLAVGAVIAAFVAGALLVRKYWQPIKAFFVALWQGFSEGVKPALAELAASMEPLVPMWHAFVAAIGSAWDEIVRFFDPVQLTAEELREVARIGLLVGQILALAFSNAVRGVAALFRFVGRLNSALSQALENVRGLLGNTAIRGVISLLPGMGAMPGSWLDVGAGQVVNAGRQRTSVSQNVTNNQTANVTVTPPQGSNPAAYGAATQRGTKRALGSMPFQLPTPVEDL